MRLISALAAALTLAAPSLSRAQTPPTVSRAQGVVVAITDRSLTLQERGGERDTIPLLGDWTVIVSKPIAVEAIKPGSYLGTTNHARADGTGTSTEVHVSPPGVTGPGVDFLMDAAAQTTMTNGVVATVVESVKGPVLAVNHGHGVRSITVPPGTPIVLNSPGDRSLVTIGRMVREVTFTPASGGPSRQFITVGENGAPPPT
jgi:hypothetical protein